MGALLWVKVLVNVSGLYQTNTSDAAVGALDTRDFLVGAKVPFGAVA
jgi:hypothetical protein